MRAMPITVPSVDQHNNCEVTLVRDLLEIEREVTEALALARMSLERCEQVFEQLSRIRALVVSTQSRDCTTRVPIVAGHHECDRLNHSPHCVDQLTSREAQILYLISIGNSNRLIAEALFLSPRTIERHIANIYLKIDVHSKDQAIAWAQCHFIDDDSSRDPAQTTQRQRFGIAGGRGH